MGARHQARELALKVLFELEGAEGDPQEVLDYHLKETSDDRNVARFSRELVQGVLNHREALDAVLVQVSPNWPLEQMSKVDRIILRIAIFEIAISRKVPVKAAINESIELAKTYSGVEAGRFVNGVLGTVAAEARARFVAG